jgi:hypothetical protein
MNTVDLTRLADSIDEAPPEDLEFKRFVSQVKSNGKRKRDVRKKVLAGVLKLRENRENTH